MTNLSRDQRTFVGTYQEYENFLESEYFPVCQDQYVLEIGPLDGHHSKLIVKNNPKILDVIEPDKSMAEGKLSLINGINNIIVDDALLVLSTAHPCDVVVCFGVLYHLHSPLHLLELIVNHCQPKYILLDSVGKLDDSKQHGQVFVDEPVNKAGTRHVRPGFKFSGLNVTCNSHIIQLAMSRLGFTLIKSNNLSVTDNFSKSCSWIAMWENQEKKYDKSLS